MRKSALFLDRDGIINIDHGYVHKQSEVEFIDGIFSLCKVAKAKGYKIFIITNQAGIGRGYFSEVDFFILMDWMREKFNQLGAKIDDIYFCPFHPTGGIGRYKVDSECRKPRPGMILQASKEYDIDLSNSVLVGDSLTDIQAGIAAGVGCNLLYAPTNRHSILLSKTGANALVDKLITVVDFL